MEDKEISDFSVESWPSPTHLFWAVKKHHNSCNSHSSFTSQTHRYTACPHKNFRFKPQTTQPIQLYHRASWPALLVKPTLLLLKPTLLLIVNVLVCTVSIRWYLIFVVLRNMQFAVSIAFRVHHRHRLRRRIPSAKSSKRSSSELERNSKRKTWPRKQLPGPPPSSKHPAAAIGTRRSSLHVTRRRSLIRLPQRRQSGRNSTSNLLLKGNPLP